MNRIQQTIGQSASISGIGLHSGKPCSITLHPAAPFHGIKFQRVDIDTKPVIEANCDLVTNSERSTTIEKEGVRLLTIEHVLSAIIGMQIDNILIECDNEEMPILDGSALPYVDLIKKCQIVQQEPLREVYDLKENLLLEDPHTDAKIIAMPCDTFKVTVMVDYNSQIVGPQHATMNSIDEFEQEIAPCRTFVFLRELENLYKSNLIKGGDVDNAIVMIDKMPTQEELDNLSKIFNRNDIKIEKEGYLNNVTLHFQNEAARHKLLDVIGDLALVGTPFNAHIIATLPGHKINTDFAKLLKSKIKETKSTLDIPKYDPTRDPVFDVHQIQAILPHRFPFLLVDKVIEMNEEFVVGIKNVTVNEQYFVGHFPDNHVMPGVLQIEAMAQCGGMLALQAIDDPKNYDVYFVKIDKAKFKRRVVPGDTLVMKVELMSPVRRGIVEMRGNIFVGDTLATEAEMMARIVKKQ
jgi:UDP-3-O-[3-hydroxymyristoyl] N-acetylglucosamine deacetylase/3-hydroxyacyl-[acyl-carrier-protein] dehydratase